MSKESDLSKIRLRLKNGNETLAQKAYVTWKSLAEIQKEFPVHFYVLRLMSEGQLKEVPLHICAELINKFGEMAFSKDGCINSETLDVIDSSYRETPDGPMLVNPFELSTAEERTTLDEIERYVRFLKKRFFRGDDLPPDEHAR